LIQKQENIEDYLDTAWTVSVLRGLVLFVAVFLATPHIAGFFNVLAATSIIRVIGISVLLKGMTNIGVVYFQRELEFDKQFIFQMSGTAADLIVAAMAVFFLRSVWALVFGLLARNLVGFVVSYLIHSYRPRVRIEVGKVKELYGFGKWVLGSSILLFLLNQGDDVLLGKVVGVKALGLYQMAYHISNLPATEITHVISKVSFPTFSKLQDHLSKLRLAYLQTLRVTTFVSFPLAGGIFLLAPHFTSIFLGDKWMPMVPAMQTLALWGLIRSIGATTGVFGSQAP
jgi:O-antigen/teichoic acid export membrane protein